MKLKKWDKIGIVALIIFVLLMAYPLYRDKGECEVARAGYECASAKEVMIENCNYWRQYNCDTNADESLVQIEWYIDNLCDIHNKYHDDKVECHNLKLACNQISGQNLCPVY